MGQTLLLIWKNGLLKLRQPVALCVELLMPLLLIAIAAGVKQALPSTDIPESMRRSFSLPAFYNASVQRTSDDITTASLLFTRPIAYTPTGGQVDEVLDIVRASVLELVGFNASFVGFDTEDEMLSYAVEANEQLQLLAALSWANIDQPNTPQATIPAAAEYTIRQDEEATYETDSQFPERIPLGPRTGRRYQQLGFVMIQNMVDQAIIQQKSGLPLVPIQVIQQPAPYPAYTEDDFARGLGFFLPLFTVFSFLYPCAMITKNLVMEKELRLREAQRLMGCKNRTFWFSWWVVSFMILGSSTAFVGMMLLLTKVVSDTSAAVIYILLYCNVLATISFGFMVSSFFSRAKVAAAMGACLYFIFYIPYFFISPNARYDSLGNGAKLLVSFFSPTAFGLATKVISGYEEQGKTLDMSNFNEPATFNDDFTVAMACAMLLIDTVLYFLITMYLDNVFPGTYGIPQKWYYFVSPTYWRGPKGGQITETDDVDGAVEGDDMERAGEKGANSPIIEPMDPSQSELFAGIDLRNLRKVFQRGKKKAVNSLSFKAYEGQITSFLGHNGAGKTTTMSMLSGLFPPSGGNAYVNGYSITTQMPKVRKNLGLCPQFDILYDNLTVEEHLRFYCKLKQIDDNLIDASIDEVLKELNIDKKKTARTKTLSGGMKRKLSVAIALVGGSKVVILDEPTAGMDPYSRRSTWEFLLRQRKGRTILLSTHFMDEADLLGDRIAIISDGQLKCIGSSLYLKQAYGAGYHLVCTAKRGTSKIADSIDVNALTRLIMSFVPVAKLESSVGAEVTYTMPSSDAKVFPDLLKALDDYSEVEDYGLSMTTMEEVFLAANGFSNLTDDDNNGETGGALDMPEKSADGPMTDVTSKHDMYDTSAKSADSVGETAVASVEMKPVAKSGMRQKLFQPSPLKTGMALKKQQYTAMVKKRYVHSKRDKGAVLCQWVFPIIFMVLAMVLAKTIKEDFDRPPLTFNINDLDTSSVPIQNLNAGNALADSVVTQLTQEFSPTLVTTVDPTTNFTLNWINTAYTDLEATIYPGYIIQTTNPTGGDDGSQLLFVTEYFQNLALHGSAIYLNVLNNAIARVYVPGMSITTTNHPLPLTAAARNERIEEGGQELAVAIFTIFAMSFLAASFVTFVVDERRTKAKHIQFVSGVDTVSFWLATYTWDLINYLIPVTVILIIIIGFQVEYYTGSNYGAVVCLFLLFGWSVIPLMYICSFGFKVPSTALASMILFNMLLGLATSLTTFIMDQYEDLEGVSEILGWVFMCVPHYCLGRGLMDISYNHLASQVAGYVSQNDLFSGGFNYSPQSALSWNVSGKNCLFMFLEGFVFFGIVLLIEYRFFIRKKPTKVPRISPEGVESDVQNERDRVKAMREGSEENDAIVIDELTKVYHSKKKSFVAVKGVSVGVPRGECFGLLGINGAGKTTTFKMLTGDLSVTSGNAYLENYSVVSALKKARKNIGYCPQFDALIGLMTGRETLQMYARLRGIQDKEVDDSVEAIIQMLQLEKWADRQAKTYSGGNKRKLSTGIALVGTPPIVFLDEPTTGMDPAAKRFLWNTLNDVRAQGLALVLTSHSMEEVSAICTRLAIMVNGEFRCLGNQQYLKNKYGDGYALVVKVNSDADVKPIREFITTNFPTSVLKEEYARMVSYQIDVKSDNMSLSEVFKKMSDAKETLNVDDFHVSQTSLEQVFIRFAKTDAALKSSTVSLEKLCEKDVIDDDEARVATTTAAGEPFVEHSNADDKDGLEKGSSSIQKRSDGNYGNHRDLDGESDGVVNADSDDEGVSGHVV